MSSGGEPQHSSREHMRQERILFDCQLKIGLKQELLAAGDTFAYSGPLRCVRGHLRSTFFAVRFMQKTHCGLTYSMTPDRDMNAAGSQSVSSDDLDYIMY